MQEQNLTCEHCGKAVLPDMKFCPYCGKTIEMQDTVKLKNGANINNTDELKDRNEKITSNSFNLTFDNELIRYPSDLLIYTELLGAIQEKTIILLDVLLKNYYSRYKTYYGLLKFGKEDLQSCTDELAEFVASECQKRNYPTVSKEDYSDSQLLIEDLFVKLEEAPAIMQNQLALEREARDLDRLSRSRFIGGGFGVGGALKGMIVGGILNSIYDSYRDSKFMDEDDAREKLNELVSSENIKKAFAGTLLVIASNMFDVTVNIVMELKPFRKEGSKVAKAAIERLFAGIEDFKQRRATIIEALKNEPTNSDIYKYFDDHIADSDYSLGMQEDCKKFSDIFGHTKTLGMEYVINARVRGESDESIARWIKYYLGTGKAAMLAKADALYRDAVDEEKKYFPDALVIIDNLMKQNYAPAYVYLARNAKLRNKTSNSVIALYTKAAALEDKDGMYELAKCYKNGYMLPANLKKAKELFIKSAKFGQPKAIEEVKELWYKGQLEETPEVKAIIGEYNHDETSAKAHEILMKYDIEGKFDLSGLEEEELVYLASAYTNGAGIVQDLQKAADCYCYLANKGTYAALYNLSNLLNNGAKVRIDLFPAIKKLIYNSNIENLGKMRDNYSQDAAMKLLVWGIVYLYGLGQKIDLQKALHFFQEGQKTDYVKQKEECASRSYYVQGLLKENAKDYEGAFKFYNTSSKKYFPLGYYRMAELLTEGKGTPKNLELAVEFYKHLADIPILDSLAKMHYVKAKLFEERRDYEKAFYEMREAVDAGYLKAMVDLGSYYETGKGVSVNYDKAVECYNAAYKDGIPAAAYRLGLYSKNICNDEANAKAWFQLFNQMKKGEET